MDVQNGLGVWYVHRDDFLFQKSNTYWKLLSDLIDEWIKAIYILFMTNLWVKTLKITSFLKNKLFCIIKGKRRSLIYESSIFHPHYVNIEGKQISKELISFSSIPKF